MAKVNKYILLILINLAVFTVSAQPGPYRFTRIDANKGLSHNQIKTFFKDSYGFMWFGTISGLNRFDGYNIKVFRNNPQDTTSIINDDVNKLFEDPEGKIWILTWNGLDIYDPVTEQFRYNAQSTVEKYGLPDGDLADIVKDGDNNFWFVHKTKGLFYHHFLQRKTYTLNYVDENIYTIASNTISCLQTTSNNIAWIIHRNGVIESLDPSTMKIVARDSVLYNKFDGKLNDYKFIVDSDNDLWIYLADSNHGLFHFETEKRRLSHFSSATRPITLSADIVRGVVEDTDKLIWVATDHGGVNVIDKEESSVSYVVNSEEDEYSLSQNSVNCLYKDDEGIIWAGTFKRGVSYFHENIIRFPLISRFSGGKQKIPFDDINAFAEDEKKNLWIGTNGGGLIYYDRSKQTFRQYLHEPGNSNSLTTNIIVSLWFDSQKVLWVGTYFGGLLSFDGQKFTRYSSNPTDPAMISDLSIWEIFEDSEHRLYVGTLTHGMDVLDEHRKKIANYSVRTPNTIHANYVPAFMEDNQGNIWIGTGYGIEVLNKKTGTFTHYLSQPGNKKSVTNNSILSMTQDSRGNIWIGTHGGLNIFDVKKNYFRSFTTEDGLPHNSILTVVEDTNNNFWLSTPNGVSHVKVEYLDDSLALQISNYDHYDGLQGKQFNENAALRTSAGELVFGGANGLNIFHPDEIPVNRIVPRVILTDLQLLNQSLSPKRLFDNRRIIKRALGLTDSIELKHRDNVISIEFAVLSFNHPEKSKYRYRLEGFDNNWIPTTSEQRKVTYTNLDPGNYVFRVIASNNDGIWNEQGASLHITVHPPWWKTTYAFIGYFLMITGALFFVRKLIQQRERMKYAIEHERQEAQRIRELDMMKLKLFTNVSHEFRTPLTLILTPIERILTKPEEPVQPGQFELIHRNAKRLLSLVNQLLDFRKLEVQEIRFNPSEGDIIGFLRETVFSFSDLSEKKRIPLSFHSALPHLETTFDQDKLEKIIFNLLSNAFKFTPAGGDVTVDVDLISSSQLQISVKDTGIGISPDTKERIFERFFQTELPKTMVNQGSGIGLSITREFVKAHNGTIIVESEPGKGSCFIVTLPVQPVPGGRSIEERMESLVNDSRKAINEATTDAVPAKKLPVLLLVEDNEDFRFYLKDNLRFSYNIIEASDGSEGWEKIISYLPDLVVSDIMMPGMNGIDFCRKIKSDPRVSHTPVILLTARTAEEQKLEGFESGAEDYITKPFNFEILQSRIRNIIHQREQFQKEFRRRIDVKASNLEITPLDEKLIDKALQVVEAKLSDPDFSVEELARELGMSRVHLYKKLQALTGKSPIEFIRNLRLQHAAQLLEKSQLTVSEVAYKVGFNNPKYFARYFKEEYNVLPSAYAASRRKSS